MKVCLVVRHTDSDTDCITNRIFDSKEKAKNFILRELMTYEDLAEENPEDFEKECWHVEKYGYTDRLWQWCGNEFWIEDKEVE